MLISQYIKTNKNTFCKSDTFKLPSPYWKVVNGRIYSVFATGKYGTSEYKENLSEACMSEEEAIKNQCGCYYKLEKISEHDKHVIKDFVLWLCDKYEIFEPEKDGYTLYADMKYHDSDEVLKEYFNENK